MPGCRTGGSSPISRPIDDVDADLAAAAFFICSYRDDAAGAFLGFRVAAGFRFVVLVAFLVAFLVDVLVDVFRFAGFLAAGFGFAFRGAAGFFFEVVAGGFAFGFRGVGGFRFAVFFLGADRPAATLGFGFGLGFALALALAFALGFGPLVFVGRFILKKESQ